MVLAIVVANLLNLLTDLLFIFGDGALSSLGLPPIGLPALGALGAAGGAKPRAEPAEIFVWDALLSAEGEDEDT